VTPIQIAVTVLGVSAIAVELWYFLGPKKSPDSRTVGPSDSPANAFPSDSPTVRLSDHV
jgi:hypothetical protein